MDQYVSKKKGSARLSPFYDEVFSLGKPRLVYKKFLAQRMKTPSSKVVRIKKAAKGAFHGDAEVLDFPMILTESDYDLISRGTLQRGRAIHSFLFDHYFGAKKYLRYPAMRLLPLQEILRRNHEIDQLRLLRPDTLQFWYAPDIVRDPKGVFRVIEDNTGFVGGFGDLEASSQAAGILSAGSIKTSSNASFYLELFEYYQKQTEKLGGGKIILLSYDQKIRVTHEDQRLASAFSAFGVEHVTQLNSLKLSSNGLSHGGRRVGFVILNRDTADIDPLDERSIQRYLANGLAELKPKTRQSLSKLLKKSSFEKLQLKLARLGSVNVEFPAKIEQLKGFWEASRAGLFGVSYVPGLEFVNDKEFYQCVELLIQIYLNEDPLLKNIKTVSLSKKSNSIKVFEEISKWVIKGTNGRGGEEVWIGKKLKPKEMKPLQALIQKDPSKFIAQEYIELSRIENHSVDMRALSMIAGDRQIVSPIPWGRAIPVTATGKVNISNGGLVAATQVMREEDT